MSVTQERHVGEFDRVDLRGVGTVYLKQGDKVALTVKGPENLIDKVRTEVSEGRLVISLRWWSALFGLAAAGELEFHVTARELRGLAVSGAGKMRSQEPLKAQGLELRLLGAGSMQLEVQARSLEAHLTGAGSITLSGTAESLDAGVTGAGRLGAFEFAAKTVRIRSSGAGESLVHATESLDVSLTGAGRVRYRGKPRLTSRVSGVGSLQPED
jgi:hypothetical protein